MKSALQFGALVALNLIGCMEGWGASSPRMPDFFARRDYSGLHSTFLQVADTNGDGIPDLISGAQDIITVLFGNGDGTFRTGPGGYLGVNDHYFAAADINGDSKVDVVYGIGNGIAVSLGNGDGTFQSAVPYTINDGSAIEGCGLSDHQET